MKAKYMGCMPTAATFTFELTELRRTIQLVAEVFTGVTLQVNPVLAARSLLLAHDDIDRVFVSMEEFQGEFPTGISAADITENEVPMNIIGLMVYKEGLAIIVMDEEDFDKQDEYPIPHEAFIDDLTKFVAMHDQTYLVPMPDNIERYQQEYVNPINASRWTATDDPLRFHTEAEKKGLDLVGWIEDTDGTNYAFVEYHHVDAEEERIELDDAHIHVYAVRDDNDDGLIHFMGYDSNCAESEIYVELILERTI